MGLRPVALSKAKEFRPLGKKYSLFLCENASEKLTISRNIKGKHR